MALENIHYPFALKLPNPEITHLTDIGPDRGYQIVTETQAGSPVPCFVGVGSTDPVMPFTTRQLKSVMDTLTVDYLVRDLSAGTVTLWYQAGKPMEIRELPTTSKHIAAQLVTSAMMFWNTIRVQQGSVAEIDVSLVTAKRGVSDPMLWLGSQQLPSRDGCQRVYGMGPVYLNSTLLEGVTGWTMTSNAQTEPVISDGETSNSYQGIRSYHPQVQLQSTNLAEIAATSFGGDAFNTLELYLRRMTSTNIFDDKSNPTHIKITINGGLRTIPGASGSPATIQPMFYGKEQAGQFTHQWDTAVTVP